VTRSKRIIRLNPLCAAMRGAAAPFCIRLAGIMLLQTGVMADESAWDCRATPDRRSWQCLERGAAAPLPAYPAAPTPRPLKPPADTPAVEAAAPGGAETEPEAASTAAPVADEPPAPPPTDQPRASDATKAPQEERDTAREPTPPAAAPVTPAPATPEPTATQDPALQAFRYGAPTPATPPSPATETEATSPEPADTMAAPISAPERAVAPPRQAEAAADAVQVTPATEILDGIGQDIDAGIDWESCVAPSAGLGDGVGADLSSYFEEPIEIAADALVSDLAQEQAKFSGNVELVQGGLLIRADELSIDRRSGDVDAQGNLLLTRPDLRVAGTAASYQLNSGLGTVEEAAYRLLGMRARGDATQAEFLGGGRSKYREITFTTCRPGASDWLLRAEALEVDQVEGLATASDATLRFFDVPILYSPTLSFPIDDRRRSGLLVPTLGQTTNTGFDVSVPYYLNLAPNYDLTLTPRLMSKRGALLGGEFRFLTPSSNGKLLAEYLPRDRDYQDGNKDRGAASFRASTRFSERSNAATILNYVSDSDYLTDLGESLAVTSAVNVLRRGTVVYHGDTWDLSGRLQYYQTLNDAIRTSKRPYSLLPEVAFGLDQPDGLAGTTYHLDAEYANFYREDSVRGHRVNLSPALSLPLRRTWGYAEPKLGAHYTGYWLTDQTPGLDDSPSDLAGFFNLDSGLYFDRATRYFGDDSTQTLEPRLYYLYVPRNSQDDQPVFDTTELDFNFDNLFRENRYSGPDRFGDANQVTLAMTSRMISDSSGEELLRASIGQILYFEDREVVLPGEVVDDDSTSSLLTQLSASLGGGWQVRGGTQWDPHDGSNGTIDQALAQIGYRGADRRVFNVAYRLRKDVTEETDVGAVWPFSERFSLIGRHNYSLRENRPLETLAGFEYGRCCWRLRAVVRQFSDGPGGDQNLTFLLQLELNGLGRLGDNIDDALERGIYGY
jgi:LPS-assembly protein